VWVVREDRGLEPRKVRTGLSSGSTVQVLEGLSPGEKIVGKGSLFVDRAAAGN
jgi:cobalt-zinc-cadmium efflux system membrane fusion protein